MKETTKTCHKVWCLEAPQSFFLKELISHATGERLLFTNRWDDGALCFGTLEQAEQYKKDFNLIWLMSIEHIVMDL